MGKRGKKSVSVAVSTKQRRVLEGVVARKLAPQQLVERCRIVLMSAEGVDNEDQSKELGVDRQRVRRWRHRWANASEVLVAPRMRDARARTSRN